MYLQKIKQRMLDRLNESVKAMLGRKSSKETAENETIKFHLTQPQKEILNIISNYVDFYHSNVNVKYDADIKFTYVSILIIKNKLINSWNKLIYSKGSSCFKSRPQVKYLILF